MTTLSTTTPVARKQHQCWYCNEMIEPGERYARSVGVYDGDFGSIATHAECDAVWQEMYHDGTLMADEGLDYGMFKRGSRCEKGCGCKECTPATKSTERMNHDTTIHS